MHKRAAWLLCCVLVLNLAPPLSARRGGGGFGRGMGRSGGRGSSGARSGVFGGSRSKSGSSNTNWGAGGNQRSGHSSSGGFGVGNNNRNRGSSGGWSGSRTSTFSKGRGVGSVMRSNTFKNAIVGAAAGYLTYQAGKAIIRAAAGPMMWNNRQYYWGANHYQSRGGQSNMCRMPIQSGDQQFGNVYFQDQTRPREIVWGCGYYEYCCGYECCRGGGAPGYGISMGTILFLLCVACCGIPMLVRYFRGNGFGLQRTV